MLVDCTELQTQLFGNLAAVGLGSVEIATSKEILKGAFKERNPGQYRLYDPQI